MAAITSERLIALEDYCGLTEFAGDGRVEGILKGLYDAAVEYMDDAGVSRTVNNSARYDLAVNSKVNQWYTSMRGGESTVDANLEPAGFRSLMSQLKFSAMVEVSNLDTSAGEVPGV